MNLVQMAKTSCGILTKKPPWEVGIKRNVTQAGGPCQKAGVGVPFAWHSSNKESVCDLCLSVTRSGKQGSRFQEHWE